MAQPEPGWAMPVEDVHDRPADLTVRLNGSRALLTTPLPGTALLTARDLTRLIEIAREARDELFRREP